MVRRGLVRVVAWPAFVAIIVAGCGVSPTAPVTAGPTASLSSPLPTATTTVLPSASATPSVEPSAPLIGLSTHPFTVLLLGGDTGFRTDAVIVVGVDPVAQTLAFVSIPRDTVDVPLPGGGVLQDRKVNSFYDLAASQPDHYPQGAGRATADLVGALLGIHIDYFAATTFAGFGDLVQAMGGTTLTLPKAVVDPYYQVTTSQTGVRFPKGIQHLSPSRALIFVRTRQGDNDFERERRQQLFLLAAGRQLVSNPQLLGALLLAAARGDLKTDFPLQQVSVLITTVGSVDPGRVRQAVLGPSVYESATSCTCGYALRPNLPAMRKLAKLYFPWAVTS